MNFSSDYALDAKEETKFHLTEINNAYLLGIRTEKGFACFNLTFEELKQLRGAIQITDRELKDMAEEEK